MCGICGIVCLNALNKNRETESIKKMAKSLEHRGPDDFGYYSDDNILLGHRRLSIIDLKSGSQPMEDIGSTCAIAFNGEIYNYRILRKELLKDGMKFRTDSDTEVIINCYKKYGMEFIHKLRGMFAFALWDKDKKRLIIARDRIGKKPLFYTYRNNKLIFASELKAIRQYENIYLEVSDKAIDYYLTYSYIPAPYSIYKDVYKLNPGHLLIFENNNIKTEKYWDINFEEKLNFKTEEEYCELIENKLKEAVKLRMISDVPLGAFLSGGIDSSAVVALMNCLSSNKVKTFSIGFEEKAYNELSYARTVAQYFDTEHYEFVVKPDALEIVNKLVHFYDEPYADSSAIPTYYLSKLTRQYVTVALNGDGGDETFAGYERYIAYSLLNKYFNKDFIQKAAYKVYKYLPELEYRSFSRRLKRFLFLISKGLERKEQAYLSLTSVFPSNTKEEILHKDFLNRLDTPDNGEYILNYFKNAENYDTIDKLLYVDIKTYLLNDLMVKVDIASMANSLEARSPFLDQELVELSGRIPSDLKLRGFQTKYILKKVLKKYLPEKIINRKKMGFGVPLGYWFRNELKDFVKEILLNNKCLTRNILRKDFVIKTVNGHLEGKSDNGYRLWALLMLELWFNNFYD